MMFVLEMFFKESGSISSKITAKPIIRRQLFKYNQDSDREIFLLQFIFPIFFFFISFSFQPTNLHPEFLALCCGKFKSPNNQSHKRKVRLSSLRTAKKIASTFVRLPIALAFSFISSLQPC